VALEDPVGPTEGFLYQIVVTNDGPSDAQGVVVTDTLDDDVTFASASVGCTHDGSPTDGDVTCDVGTLPAGESRTYLIAVTAGDVVSGTELANTVVASSATDDPEPDNSDTVTTTVQTPLGPTADVGITKTQTSPTGVVTAGEQVTYTLTVTNSGVQPATNVWVLDLAPAGTTVVAMTVDNPDDASAYCSLGGACYLGTVYTDTTATVTVVLEVAPDFEGDTLVNAASVSADQADTDPGDNFAEASTTVDRSADLSVVKAAMSDPVLAGDVLLYQLLVTNDGPSAATGVVLTDRVPISTTFVGASPPCIEVSGVVSCAIGTLDADDSASLWISVRIDEDAPDQSVIENTASISATTPDPDPSYDTATVETTVEQPLLGPADLSITKSADPDPVVAGELLTYTLVVTNSGPAEAQNVRVLDVLPSGVEFVSAEASQGDCNSGVSCELGDLALGATATITIVVRVDSDQLLALDNYARVAASNPDPDDGDNGAGPVVTQVETEATFSVAKVADPDPATPGETLSYQIVVENLGPSDAQDVEVYDNFPEALENVVASPSQGTCSVDQIADQVYCDLGTLAAGDVAVIDVVGTVASDREDPIVNLAWVESETLDPGVRPSDTITTTLSPEADLMLEKDAPATANAGEAITYTLTVYNLGPSDAQGVVVTDTLPGDVTYQSGCADNGDGTVTCGPTTVPAGGSVVYNLVVVVATDLEPGTSLENEAVVDAETPDENRLNDRDDADTSVVALADLTLSKSGPLTATAGTQVVYTIVVSNAGPSAAQSVDVKDTLPPGVSLDSASVERSGAGPTACGGTVCQVGDMALDEVITITVVGTVDPGVEDGTVLTNTATVFSDSPDPEPDDNQDTAPTAVEASASLRVSKIDLDDPVGPTEGFLYQIVVTNDGPSDAQDVVVTDTLDANVTFENASIGCTHDGSPADGVVTCDVGTLPAGESRTYLIAVKVGDVAPGIELTNVVTATSPTADLEATDSVTTAVKTEIGPTADVGITKTQISPTGVVTAGERVTYTLTITNSGPSPATNVRVLELVPAGTTAIEITARNPDSAAEDCSLGGSCYLGTVYTDTEATVTVVLEVDPDFEGDSLVNTASVSADQADTDPSDNFAQTSTPVDRSASLSIEKLDLGDPVLAGEIIVYQLVVSNGGPSAATGVLVSDTVPLSTTFVAASPPCVESGGVISCALGTLAPDDTETVWIQVRVDDLAPDGTVITNTATVSAETPDPDDGDNTATEGTLVAKPAPGLADLSITKSADPDPVVVAGELLTYTLGVINAGPADARNVRVVDALPSGVTFVSAQPSQGICNSGVTCELGDLLVGESATITIVVQVDSGQFDPMTNLARVAASNPDPDLEDNQAQADTETRIITDLALEKRASADTATPGTSFSYEIIVTNNGPSDSPNVVVDDDLPADLEGVSWSTSQGSCSILGTGTLQCSLGYLPAGGEAVISIVGTVAGDAIDDLVNAATIVECGCWDDPDDLNNSDTVTTTVQPNADLALLKRATPTVDANELITYTLTVFNNGPSDAIDVLITDTLPAGVTVVLPLPGGCGQTAADTVVCGPFDLLPGEGRSFVFNVETDPDIEPGTLLENEAVVGSETPDGNPMNDRAAAYTSITSRADLGVVKRGPSTVTAGDEIVYEVEVTNNGPSTARDVDLKDLLPPGVQYVAGSASQGLCVSGICQLGDVGLDETVTIVITGSVGSDVSGVITNTAMVFADSEDDNPDNDSDTAATTVETEADLGVTKIDLEDPVAPGGGLVYQIVVVNQGPSDAQDVLVTDTLDSRVTFSSGSPGCSLVGDDVVCEVGTLAAGESRAFLIAVKVGDVPAGSTLLNQALVGSSTFDPDLGDNDDSVETAVEIQIGPSADLSLTKVGDPPSVFAGELVTYTLTVTNAGPQIATGVTVFDLVPMGATLVEISAENPDYDGEYCSASGVCYLGTVYTDTVATVTAVVQVDPGYRRDVLENTARVDADQPDPDAGDNIASDVTDVGRQADLALTKDDLIDPVIAGDVIEYRVTVVNQGPSDAEGVVISDTVPAGTTYVGGTAECTEFGGRVTCDLGTLPAGEEETVSIDLRVDPTLPDGTFIDNLAEVSSSTGDPEDANNSDGERTEVQQSSLNPTDLSISKSDSPDPVMASDLLTYTLVVVNEGPAPASNVALIDALPSGVTFVSAETTKGLCNGGVTCLLGDMAVGEAVTVTVVVQVDSSQSGNMINRARVSSANPDLDPDNNEDSAITEVIVEADLSITKVADPEVATPGGRLRYEIVVTNDGPADAEDVVVFDALPDDLENVTLWSSQGYCAPVTPGSDLIRCRLGTVAKDERVLISIMGTVPGDVTEPLENTVAVESPTDDPDEGNNADEVVTPVLPQADLELRKRATATVYAGEVITYTLRVFNHGPSDALDVIVNDELPAGVTVVALPGECAQPTPQTVRCGPFNMIALAERSFTFYVRTDVDIEPGTSLENVATVASETPDVVPINNTDTADTSILGYADLELVKRGPAEATAGDEITYVIVVTNTGPGVAHDVDIKDVLPPEVELISASVERSGSGDTACSGAICQVGDVAAGEVLRMTVVGLIDPLLGEDVITNDATVFSDTPDPDPEDNSDSTNTSVLPGLPAVTIDKRIVAQDTDMVYPNFVTFTIEIENVGPTTIDILPLFDDYDTTYLSFVDATPYPQQPADDGLITWADLTGPAPHGFGTNLAPGQSFEVTVVFRIAEDIQVATTNRGWVYGAMDVDEHMAPEVEDEAEVTGLPTAIFDVLNFEALPEAGSNIALTWDTAAELSLHSFRIYRAAGSQGASLVDAQGASTGDAQAEATPVAEVAARGSGSSYAHTDPVPSSGFWTYWLSAVSTSGAEQLSAGPVTVGVGVERLYLPMVLRR
jgi:uncharacterized repeat protein (TIGR01451 family)